MPQTRKLRCQPAPQPFNVVLVEPEIPPNTGAVARTCAATGSRLNLVGKLGFDVSERAVRRAGIDYWHLVDLARFSDLAAMQAGSPPGQFHYFSSDACKSYLDAPYRPGDFLVFGCESVGLPKSLLRQHPEQVYGIPTSGGVRSLNLSNSVSIVLFEALRSSGCLAETSVQPASTASHNSQ